MLDLATIVVGTDGPRLFSLLQAMDASKTTIAVDLKAMRVGVVT